MNIRIIVFVVAMLSAQGMNAAGTKINVKRLEPSSWWIGMKNPNLQLLVYGENIALTEVRMHIPGVRLHSVTKVESINYLFLDLNISDSAQAGTYPIEFVRDGKLLAKCDFKLLERKPNSALRKGFDASDVIYLLMPDRFSNGNPANDSTQNTYEKAKRSDPDGRHGGDIQGIVDHLDYIQELGVTSLWSTPLMENNMERTSYHGYAITDYYKIDPRYGTNADYENLSEQLHKRGMKLIMDVVTNHCGLKHWWMKDLPTSDWVNQFPEFTRTNYQASTVYDPYASAHDKSLNLQGWFDTSMPDINLNNPLMLTYMIQNAVWWIEYANLDGLRVDTYPYNEPLKMAAWTKALMDEYPNFNIVGECWVHSPQEISYWQKGTKNANGFESTLPLVMDFALHDVFSDVFKDEYQDIRRFYNHFTLDFAYTKPENMLVFTENHDTQRFNKIINNDFDKFKLAYTLLFTIRGIPEIYYGSEVLMTGNKSKGDGDIRRDFPGGWQSDKHNAFSLLGRTQKENEAFYFMKKLLNWRKVNPVVHSGKTMQYISYDNCYVYFRYNTEKTIMVIINNSNEPKKLDTKRFEERMHGFTQGYDIISEKQLTNLSVIVLPAKTSMILELSK